MWYSEAQDSRVHSCFASCDKFLRFNYTNYPPFKAYGVEGWWLDNLLKAGKLSRKAYLKLAAQVTVGFQKRLADCKAAERYLRDEALQDAVCAHAKALEPATLPMKSFPVIEAVDCRTPVICVSCRACNIKQQHAVWHFASGVCGLSRWELSVSTPNFGNCGRNPIGQVHACSPHVAAYSSATWSSRVPRGHCRGV